MSKHLILATENYVKKLLQNDSSHDWWHVSRVWQTAKYIGTQEQADLFVIEMAALLHDLEDWKFQKEPPFLIKNWLQQLNIAPQTVTQIEAIIDKISFQGAGVNTEPPTSLEGKIVQDADRLDAMGAIGIARTFAYGGFKNREIYNPHMQPLLHKSFQEYQANESTTINHFYEKLLLIKDKMNTTTGKKIAQERHMFMENFLVQFFKEVTEMP